MKDNSYVSCFSSDVFCPLRDIGPHIPSDVDTTSPLCFFQLFFDDYVTQQILHSTLKYADSAEDRLKSPYNKFSKCPMTTEELFRFIGALILLGIHGVQNHRFAWSITKAQYMIRLNELLSCERFEHIGTFLHLITPEEEESLSGCILKKILPIHNYIKAKCSDLYQPCRSLSIDERMVKSKARTQFRQYIRNKPTKWGFKYWVLADVTGYTVDFDLYIGKGGTVSSNGLAYDVVMKLLQPYWFQGYEVFFDNFYTNPILLKDLVSYEIVATGTLNVTRKEVPREVSAMKQYVEKCTRGVGYYYRQPNSNITYCCWHDTKTVTLASTAYPGHTENTVSRRVKDPNP